MPARSPTTRCCAEELGYKVLVAEGSPIVLKIIVEGYVDGILGVACLNVLEKAIDKVLIAGVPSYAIPLHSGDCMNTTLDESWVWDCLEKYEPLAQPLTASYIPIMRQASRLFTEDFDRLMPRIRSATPERGTITPGPDRGCFVRLARQRRQAISTVHYPRRLRRPDGWQTEGRCRAGSIVRLVGSPR